MRKARTIAYALMLSAGTLFGPGAAGAAEAVNCVDQYLLCLNDATQEEGAFWRTLKEAECGLDYYGCIRRKAEAR